MAQLGNTVVNGSLRVVGDFYANGYIDTTVTLTAAGWSGSGLYTQTVTVAGVQADNNYRVYKYISSGATADKIKTYNKNFGYITEGYATSGANQITFTTIKKPTANVTIRVVGDSNVEKTTVENTEVTSMKSDIASINADINTLNTSLANNYYTKTPQNLPSGFNSTDRASMNHLKNGWYWHCQDDGTSNFPSDWGFMIKFGFENDGDFSALYFTQMSGTIYRCSGNANGISDWVAI